MNRSGLSIDYIFFLYNIYEYIAGIIDAAIITAKRIYKELSKKVKNVITNPAIINSFPASLWVLFQFSSLASVHGSLIPVV